MLKYALYIITAGFFGYMFAQFAYDLSENNYSLQSALAAGVGGKFGCLLLDYILIRLKISIF